MIQDYVIIKPDPSVKAIVLYGDCLYRKYTNTTLINFPIPSLAVGGEKDGLMRVSRMAEAYYKVYIYIARMMVYCLDMALAFVGSSSTVVVLCVSVRPLCLVANTRR